MRQEHGKKYKSSAVHRHLFKGGGGEAEHSNGAENGTFRAKINVCIKDVKESAGGSVLP